MNGFRPKRRAGTGVELRAAGLKRAAWSITLGAAEEVPRCESAGERAAHRRHPLAMQIETDELFGDLTVHVNPEDGCVEVGGTNIPSATLQRLDGAKPDPHSPIGTRDAEHLALRVAGTAARISPGAGRVSRRSYRVDVEHGEVRYRLVPDSFDTSKLLRNGTKIGRLCADAEGGVSAQWEQNRRVESQDATVGYLLAAAFGTGAQHFLMTVIEIFFHT